MTSHYTFLRATAQMYDADVAESADRACPDFNGATGTLDVLAFLNEWSAGR